MATAQTVLEDALREIGCFPPDGAVSAGELNEGLNRLNRVVSALSLEGLLINAVTRETFTLTAGQASYTWYTGGNFNSARPAQILDASATIGTIDYPVALIEGDDYEAIGNKTLRSDPASVLWFNPAYPQAVVYLWPVPASGYSLNIQSLKPLTAFAALSTTVSLPDGYETVLILATAASWANTYGTALSLDQQRELRALKRRIKVANSRTPTLDIDLALVGPRRYDIESDCYR